MTRVFIVGSCVSRDAWELAAPESDLAIVEYVARTSIASAFANPFPTRANEITVRSNWQYRQLLIDSEKTLKKRLTETPFDILLIDLIDERFEIFERQGSVLTNSFATREAGLGNQALKLGYRMLEMTEPERSKLWAKGWSSLCNIVAAANPDALIIMNEVQWGTHPSIPPEAKPEMTAEANRYLRTFYRHAKKVSGNNFRTLSYSSELFKPDPNHKWGPGPFHYKVDFYSESIRQLTLFAEEHASLSAKAKYITSLPAVNRHPHGNLSASELGVCEEAVKARLGIKNYSIDSEYLTFGRANILKNPAVSLDNDTQLPINSTTRHPKPHYNPTTIGYYGLESISKFYITRDRLHLAAAERVAQWAIHAINHDGVWPSPYEHHWFPGRAGRPMPYGWPSALSQGYLLSHLARMYLIHPCPEFKHAGELALKPFEKTIEEGGVLRLLSGDPMGLLGHNKCESLSFFEEYPTELPSLVLNGFMFALLGLYDFFKVFDDKKASQLYKSGEKTLERLLPFYDLGYNTSYDLTHLTSSNWMTPPNACRPGYHQTHMIQLSAFNLIESGKYEQIFLRWALYNRGVSIKGN